MTMFKSLCTNMNKKHLLLRVTLTCLFAASIAQSTSADEWATLDVGIMPSLTIPVGEESRRLYALSGGGTASATLRIDATPGLTLDAGVGGTYLSVSTRGSVLMASALLGGGYESRWSSPIGLGAFGLGGYYYGFLAPDSDAHGGGLALSGGVRANLTTKGKLRFSLELALTSFIPTATTAELSIAMRRAYRIGEKPIPFPILTIEQAEIEPVFPALLKSYVSAPLGTLVIGNSGSGPANEVRVELFVSRHMDTATAVGTVEVLEPDESIEMPIVALFNDSVLDQSEGSIVAARLTVSFRGENGIEVVHQNLTLEIRGRNELTWDDDRKLAAFITSREPDIRSTSQLVARHTRSGIGAATDMLQHAAGVFAHLQTQNYQYVPDVVSPYAIVSGDPTGVDSVQFPTETLRSRAGDCDDLSALYCALLESVGTKTAFVTVPGHVFPAFHLPNPERPIDLLLADSAIAIHRTDGVWIPVEITALHGTFVEAARAAFDLWSRHAKSDDASFSIVRDAWNLYSPTDLPESLVPYAPHISDSFKTFADDYQASTSKFLLDEFVAANPPTTRRNLNALAIVHSHVGRYAQARAYLDLIPKESRRESDRMNLGTLLILMGDPQGAARAFSDAVELSNDPERVIGYVVQLADSFPGSGLDPELISDSMGYSLTSTPELDERSPTETGVMGDDHTDGGIDWFE